MFSFNSLLHSVALKQELDWWVSRTSIAATGNIYQAFIIIIIKKLITTLGYQLSHKYNGEVDLNSRRPITQRVPAYTPTQKGKT